MSSGMPAGFMEMLQNNPQMMEMLQSNPQALQQMMGHASPAASGDDDDGPKTGFERMRTRGGGRVPKKDAVRFFQAAEAYLLSTCYFKLVNVVQREFGIRLLDHKVSEGAGNAGEGGKGGEGGGGPAASFQLRDRVRVHGLVKAAQHNGATGEIVGCPSPEAVASAASSGPPRWRVRQFRDGAQLSCKAANLEAVAAEERDDAVVRIIGGDGGGCGIAVYRSWAQFYQHIYGPTKAPYVRCVGSSRHSRLCPFICYMGSLCHTELSSLLYQHVTTSFFITIWVIAPQPMCPFIVPQRVSIILTDMHPLTYTQIR